MVRWCWRARIRSPLWSPRAKRPPCCPPFRFLSFRFLPFRFLSFRFLPSRLLSSRFLSFPLPLFQFLP
jgi:hypothetical protein